MQSQHHMLPLVVDGASYLVDDKAIIEDVSFTIRDAGLTILLGPNGAGKSTLLKLCHGLLSLSSGSIRWGDVNPREAQQKQAMVFQRPVLLRRSAAENIDHVLKLRRVPSAERARVIEQSLKWAGLAAIADMPARKLSGGEQQGLTIARAWALNPEVLLLDEPTANLDPGATRRVEDLIRSFAATGRKVIMATHNIAQAQRLADEVLFLNHGRLLEHAPARQFMIGPSDPLAARFIAGELVE
ncbi:MAG: phosphate ABC transporter ATP-binding protein [Myxococcales bacterium]|nr:MAG: phosphate ABC transporter ATP-binding protein [Myxococcales bacterium]